MSHKAKMCKSPKNIIYDKIEYEHLNTNCTIVGSNNLHLVKKPQIVTGMSPAYSNPSPGYPPSPYSSPASLKSPSPQNIKPPTPQPNTIPVMQIIHNHPAVITRPMHASQPQNVIKLKPPLNILPKPSASPQQSPKPSVSPQIVLPANQQATIMPTAQPLLLNQMPMLAPGVQFILRPQTAKLQGQMQQTPQGLILQSGGQQLLQLQPPRSQPMVRVLANGVGLPTTTYVTHMAPNNNIHQTSSTQSTPPKKKPNKKKKQKLDLANIMKLSGIGDDDDVQFESDASQSESEHNAHSQPATPQPQPTTPTIVQPPTQVVQPQGNVVDNKSTKVGNIQISAVPQTINTAGTPLVQVLNQAYQGGTQTATAQPTSIPFNPFITPNFTINNGLMVQRSGGFKLALGEDGRLVLQHDPNLNQDLQSQVLLQSIFGLNGGLVLQPSIDQQIHSQTVQTIQQQSVQTIQQQTVQSQTIQTVQHQIVQPQTLQTFQSQIQGQLQSLLQQQNLGSQPIAIQPQNITMQPQGLQVSQALSLQSQPIHSQSQPISLQSQTQPITIHSQSQPIIQSHPQSLLHPQPQQINLNSQNQQIIQNQPTQSINIPQPITIQSSQPSITIHSQPITIHSQHQPITIQSQSQPLTIQSNSHGQLKSQPMTIHSQPMTIQSQPMTIQSQPMTIQSQPMTITQPMTIQSQPMTIQSQPMTIQSNSQPNQALQQQSNLQPLINLSHGNQIFSQNGMQIHNHQPNNPPTSQQPFAPNPGVTLSQGNIGTQPVLKVQPFQKTQPPVQTVHPIHHHNNQQQQPAPPPPTSYVVNLTPEQLEQLKRNGQLTVNGQTIFMQRAKTDDKKTSPKIKPIKKVNKIASIKEKAANNLEKTINNVVKDSVKSSLVSALQSPNKCPVTQASVQTQVSTPKTQPSAIIQPSVQQTQIQPKIQIAQPKVIVPPSVQPTAPPPAEPPSNNQEVDRFLGQLIEETQPPPPNNAAINPAPPPVIPPPSQRVHTIQLTPQKQQHLKSIQLQIQTLSARMTSGDTEMQDALKLLFQEQQKILATGKLLSPDKVFYHNNQLIVNNSVVKSEVIAPQTRPPPVSTVTNGPAQPPVTPTVVQPPKVSVSIPSTVNEIVQNTAPVVQKTAPVIPVPPVVATPSKTQQQRFLPLYTKAQLIEQQLNTDQNGAVKPDIQTPFKDKTDACKRLIRYHCFDQPVLSQKDLNKADEIFELTAKHFIDKFGRMVDKYRYLLHKESQRHVQTSELMMLDRKVLAEEQESLVKLRQEINEASMEVQQPGQHTNSSDSQTEQEEYDEWACIQRELGCLPLDEKPPITSTATLATTTTTTSTVSTTTSTTCSQSMKRSSSADSRLETLKRFRVDKHCKKTEITNTKAPNYQSSTQSSNTNVYTTTVVHGTNYQSNEINQRSIQTIGRTIVNSNPRGMNPSQPPRNPDNLPFNSIHSYSNSLHIQNPMQRVNMHPSIHQHVVHNQQLLQRNVQHYSTQHIVQHITHTVHHTQQIQNSSVQNSVHHSSSVHSQNSYSSGNEELDNNDSIDEQVQSAIDSILNLQQNTSLDLDETVQNMLS